MIHQLLASLPKALATFLGTVVITGGAVGAAASAGGGEVPGPVHAVFSALGFGLESEIDDDSATATPHAKRKASAVATGSAFPGLPGKDFPSTSSIPGLCRAASNGSPNKLNATAFKRLQNSAAAAGQDIEEYCAGALKPASSTATPTATGTPAAGTTQSGLQRTSGRPETPGKPEAPGNSQGHGPAYSPAGVLGGNSGPGNGGGNVPEGKGKPDTTSSGAGAAAGSGSGVSPKGNSPKR